MKTKISIFAITLFAFAFTLKIYAQSNNYYVWIHGLGGKDKNSWTIYQNVFTPTNSVRPEYESNKGIELIANGYMNENRDAFGRNTILIGHSMGGLVARQLERNHSSSIKGIITIGTGHQGAQFAKELRNGLLNNLKNKVMLRVNSCLTTTTIALGFTFPGISPALVNTRNVVNGITAIFVSPIGDIALNEIAGGIYHPDLIRDLQPNSEFFKRLEQRKINVPILTFASEEDRWQIARTAYCAKNYEKLAKDENINNDGRFDMIGYNVLNTTTNVIKTGGHVHSGFAVACGVGGFFNPSLWAAAAAHGVAAATWYSTSGYIDNGLDYDHAELVGATRTVIVTKEFKFLWKKWTEDIPIQVAEPHDGVVPVKSQQLLKSRGNNVIWANTSIKGVNHMEQRNHPNTKREFDAVLDGRSYRPDIFDKKR